MLSEEDQKPLASEDDHINNSLQFSISFSISKCGIKISLLCSGTIKAFLTKPTNSVQTVLLNLILCDQKLALYHDEKRGCIIDHLYPILTFYISSPCIGSTSHALIS
jgi:hypothetical protein